MIRISRRDSSEGITFVERTPNCLVDFSAGSCSIRVSNNAPVLFRGAIFRIVKVDADNLGKHSSFNEAEIGEMSAIMVGECAINGKSAFYASRVSTWLHPGRLLSNKLFESRAVYEYRGVLRAFTTPRAVVKGQSIDTFCWIRQLNL